MGKQTALRDLAKDYSRGIIDKNTYRKSRTELISDIIEGNVEVKDIDYLPPLAPAEPDDITANTVERQKRDSSKTQLNPGGYANNSKNQATADVKQTEKRSTTTPFVAKKSAAAFISISIAVVIGLIILVVLFYFKQPELDTVNNANTTNSSANNSNNVANAASLNLAMAGEKLLTEFINKKNWSNSSLDQFTSDWLDLSDEQRAAAIQTKRMQRMNDSIYKQFLEEKALASIDSEKAIGKQEKLIAFARSIGINDNRLVIEY